MREIKESFYAIIGLLLVIIGTYLYTLGFLGFLIFKQIKQFGEAVIDYSFDTF